MGVVNDSITYIKAGRVPVEFNNVTDVTVHVSFANPMPTANYATAFGHQGGSAQIRLICSAFNMSVSGFDLLVCTDGLAPLTSTRYVSWIVTPYRS